MALLKVSHRSFSRLAGESWVIPEVDCASLEASAQSGLGEGLQLLCLRPEGLGSKTLRCVLEQSPRKLRDRKVVG